MSKRTIDHQSIRTASYAARKRCRDTIELAKKLVDDPEREERLASQNCVACHYFLRIAGAAMTEASCASCGQSELYGSTDTDLLCANCAKERDLCKRCGGQLDVWKHPDAR